MFCNHIVVSASLLAAILAPSVVAAQGVHAPNPVVFITYDNSLSMDFDTDVDPDGGTISIPEVPADCTFPLGEEPQVTRHIIASEALTGSYIDYCPVEQVRTNTLGTRDDGAPIPHFQASFAQQRRDGLIDVYGDNIYFGVGTYDSIESVLTNASGDYSYGPDHLSINLGLANYRAPMGGLVSPLPPGWVPDAPGALDSFRIQNNSAVQTRILSTVPGLGSPIAPALEDVQHLRHFDPGMRSDPFAACRPFAHVLVTDGVSSGLLDQTGYGTEVEEATSLANGTDCVECSEGDPVFRVPTYVIGFPVDDDTLVEEIAEAAGTCAIWNDDRTVCLERAFRVEAQAEMVFALGMIFNQFLGGEMSFVRPLTSTIAVDGGIGMVRFRAGSRISTSSPYWTGTLAREVFTCEEIDDGDPENAPVRALTQGETIEFADQFVDLAPDERNILTARLDVAARGASCERQDCPIDDPDCMEDGAIPDPAASGNINFGDGTGGVDAGGAEDDPVIESRDAAATCSSDSYTRCNESCAAGDTECTCRCQEFNACGTCGYIAPATAPVCPTLDMTLCGTLCLVVGLLTPANEDCTCDCQDQLDCGTCADGRPIPPPAVADAATRDSVDGTLQDARDAIDLRGNDDLIPTPSAAISFDTMEVVEDSCLIPLDRTLFVNNDLTTAISTDTTEAERAIEFARGETLETLADDGLLDGPFLADLAALHDRREDDVLGSFLHSDMALLGRPTRLDRGSAGYLEFVTAAGSRGYTLFIGGNDGMLHAFDALTGTELWGIVPPSFLPQLPQMVMSHRISVDGSVVVRDLRCSQTADVEQWCTLLAVSYRGGGSGAMVLDVTNPEEPRFLYEVTGEQIGELGLGYPRPLLGNMLIGSEVRPVLVLAGGQPMAGPEVVIGSDKFGSHEGEVLAILDAVTGEIYRQFDPVSHPDLFTTCGPVSGSPSGWSPDQFTRIFAGTQRGCLLRVDTSSTDPLQWEISSIYETGSAGAISFPPALASRADGRLVIVFGHGTPDEFEHVNQQANLVSLNEDLALLAGDEDTLSTFALGSASVNFEIRLETGEFLTSAPIVSDGIIYVATWVPDAEDACAGGSARVYGIDYLGDTSVSGPDPLREYAVTIDSDRILARMENPDFDPLIPDSEPFLKFLGEAQLGLNTVVFGVNIQAVPSCTTFVTTIENEQGEAEEVELAAGATTRRLIVDAVASQSHTGGAWSADGGDGDGGAELSGGDFDNGLTLLDLEQDLPQPAVTAVALDWGVVLEF